MPCEHAIAALAYLNKRLENHVHKWLTMNALDATYQHYIQPVNSQEYWTITEHPKPEPPKLKRPIGRPKKRRRKDSVSEDMPGSQQHKTRKSYAVTCPKCGETGHYEKTCKGPTKPKLAKKPRVKKTTTQQSQPTKSQVKKTTTQQSQPTKSQVEKTTTQVKKTDSPIRLVAPVTPSTSHVCTPSLTSTVVMQSIRPSSPPFRPPRYVKTSRKWFVHSTNTNDV